MHGIDMESQSLEERHCVLTTNLLENDGELVIGDLIDEVTLELNNDVISSEHRTEGVALLSEETEAVAFADKGIIKPSFNTCLSGHDGEIFHVLETLVANLNSECESLCLGINISRADLLKFNLRLQLLNCLLNDRVRLVESIDDELRSVESESVSGGIICSKLRRDSRDTSGSKNPIRGFTW